MFNTGLCSFNTHENQRDKHALLNFKKGVIDPSGVLSSWSTKQDCCEWSGVKCDNITSRVTQLSLPCSTTLPTYPDKEDKSLCLTGSIYLSLLLIELEFLDYLNLRNNDFLSIQVDHVHSQNCHDNISVATSPRQCVNSSALRHLDLSLNTNLAINSLQWLSRISSLEYLNLRGIDLHKETNWLQLVTMLPSLSLLNMRACQLEDLSLSFLRFLQMNLTQSCLNDLSSSSLIGHLPKGLLNLRELESLVLEDNNFDGPIPDWLGKFEHLQDLILGINMFSGSIPINLGNLSSLITLDVVSNRLTGVVEGNSIDGNLSNVLLNSTFIDLSSNGLKGFLPQLSPNVAVATLSNNSLSGDMSPLLCDHKMLNEKNNLLFLDISINHLSGGLTNCWKNWKSLVAINLGSNNLTGKIPSSMGLLSNLTSLHLHENMLYGEIPPSLQNCHYLMVFNVRNNHLSGNIPNWIPHHVKALQLRSNHFSGEIPLQICQMSSLIIVDVADNTISGPIPSCLGNITALVFNNASRHTLSFSFPSFRDRYYINDDSLELVTKGQVLEYDKNLHFVTLIDMSSNNLSGTIPPQMFSLIGLCSLNLSHNKLIGKIPNEIGNMKNLESLDFSTNQLMGEIPQSLSILSFLGYLNLSFNNLTGKIPSGTQLQGFNALSYIGNPDLCGPPLPKICLQDGKPKGTKPINEDQDKSEFLPLFYIGMESGFLTGFLGVCCAIFLNRKWRHTYFNFLYALRDRLYVMVVINMNHFRRG
ncbi:Receptor-like protein 12, partial [Mucuna pruriens]